MVRLQARARGLRSREADGRRRASGGAGSEGRRWVRTAAVGAAGGAWVHVAAGLLDARHLRGRRDRVVETAKARRLDKRIGCLDGVIVIKPWYYVVGFPLI